MIETGSLSCFVDYQNPHPSQDILPLIKRAARALEKNLDSDDSASEALTAVLNTAHLASLTRTGHFEPASVRIRPEAWNSLEGGLLNLDLSWRYGYQPNCTPAPTRLFEIGFFADQNGNLVIPGIHRHLLGMLSRSQMERTHNKSELNDPEFISFPKYREKKRGDSFYNKFAKKTGFIPEALGLLATVLVLGPHVSTGNVSFYKLKKHPAYQRIKGHPDLEKRVDFRRMLLPLNINSTFFKETNDSLFSVSIPAIIEAFIQNFPSRSSKYKNTLVNLYQGQLNFPDFCRD